MKTTMMPNHNSPDTEVVDIISSLPEAIRNHIVSFLPMVDAIRTSILSKPWRDVCSSLSNLDFDQQLFEEMPGTRIDFTEFVSQVIDHLDGSNLESFKLSIVFDDSIVRHIHSWISYVLQHNVKELKVFVVSGKLDFLPRSLFTSRTLTVLCLSDILLELPTVIVFPMLKLLEFERVSWSDVEETYRLISSCPLLESLILIRCDWWSSNILVISAPNLKRLVLEPAPSPKEVRISCPNLYEIRYLGPQPVISLDTLSSLVIAKLNVFPFKPFKESIEILIGLQNVVQLTISESTLEILSRVRNLFSNNQLALNAVKNLDLTVFTTENQVQFVAFLLTIFPNIQTLTIAFEEPGRFACFLNMEAHRQPLNVSDLGALKHIEIREIKGNDNELDLVRHLLENAKNLVIMKINYSKDLDEDESMRNVTGEKIKKFVTASPDAMVAFV